MAELNYTWVIENFSKCSARMEKVIEDSQFKLELLPNESNNNMSNRTLIRILHNEKKLKRLKRYHLAVIGRNNEKLLVQGEGSFVIILFITVHFQNCNNSRVYFIEDGQLISTYLGTVCFGHLNIYRPYLFDLSNGMLHNDTLMIYVEIYVR